MSRRGSVLLVFVDGVGIGEGDPDRNPFATAGLPNLRALLGDRALIAESFAESGRIVSERAVVVPVDARLGVPGRPQSGTGQATLLTGHNAPKLFGRHFGAWVPTPLRPLLAEQSLFARSARAGRRTVFANARSPLPPGAPLRRPPAFPFAAETSGIPLRDGRDLARGEAVLGALDTRRLQPHPGPGSMPIVSAAGAGANLARVAAAADFTAFAHYDTDAAGHKGDLSSGVAALERVDAFLGGLIEALPPEILVVITSDHGNLEDAAGGHTLNPVPLIAMGPGGEDFSRRVQALTDVAPAIADRLGLPPEPLPDPLLPASS